MFHRTDLWSLKLTPPPPEEQLEFYSEGVTEGQQVNNISAVLNCCIGTKGPLKMGNFGKTEGPPEV